MMGAGWMAVITIAVFIAVLGALNLIEKGRVD